MKLNSLTETFPSFLYAQKRLRRTENQLRKTTGDYREIKSPPLLSSLFFLLLPLSLIIQE